MDGSCTSGANKFVRASIALPSIGGTTVLVVRVDHMPVLRSALHGLLFEGTPGSLEFFYGK